MDMENIGLTMLRRRHGGLGEPMVENGLRVVQAMTTGELPIARRSAISRNFGQRVTSPVQSAAPSSIVAFRAEEATVTPLPNAPLAPSASMMRVPALTGVGDWPVTGPELPVAHTRYASADVYQSSLPLMEGFNPLESSGGGNSTVRAKLPLAFPKVQAKPVGHTAAQAFQGAPAYASGAVAMPLQRSPTAPASPSAMPPPATNSDTHKVVEQALNDVSQPNAPEIDLERLASAVYQIIERRLIRERESMGL